MPLASPSASAIPDEVKHQAIDKFVDVSLFPEVFFDQLADLHYLGLHEKSG